MKIPSPFYWVVKGILFVFVQGLLFSSGSVTLLAQDMPAVWRVDFDHGPCSGTNRFTYLCRDTGQCYTGSNEHWCIISEDKALSEGIPPSPDSGYMYAGYITSAKSESHRAYPCADYDGIFSNPDGVETPLVNKWWVWFDDEGESWGYGYWHHFVTLADKYWNVVTMSVGSDFAQPAKKTLSIAHTGIIWKAPVDQRIMLQREWVQFIVYLEPDFIHATGEKGLMIVWMNGKKMIIGGGEFDNSGKNNLENIGGLMVKAHWGVYGTGALTKGRQYNDDIGIWKAADYDTVSPLSPSGLTVSEITHNSCRLSWTASPDTMLVAYEIYSDTVLMAATAFGTTVTVNNLKCNLTYNFKLLAKDIGNNLSVPVTVQVTTDTCPYYKLMITGGTGSGLFKEEDTVIIHADSAAEGFVFLHWTGDVMHVNDTDSTVAVIVMPDKDISISAVYGKLIENSIIDDNMLVWVYPNPADDILYVNSSEEIKMIYISDALGRKLLIKNPGTSNTELDLSGIVPGLYYLYVQVSGSSIYKTIKLVVF